MFESTFESYVVLMVATGILILSIDVKTYKKYKLIRERRFSRFLGWLNVIIGTSMFIINWAYQNWFW